MMAANAAFGTASFIDQCIGRDELREPLTIGDCERGPPRGVCPAACPSLEFAAGMTTIASLRRLDRNRHATMSLQPRVRSADEQTGTDARCGSL
jgi:hypothetical protein